MQHQIQKPTDDDKPLRKIKLNIPDTSALEALLNGEKVEEKHQEAATKPKRKEKKTVRYLCSCGDPNCFIDRPPDDTIEQDIED
jgi:hypothetical protein